MKGLLYKEFFVGKKTYLSVMGLSFVFAVFGILVCVSMICGNLSYLPGEDPRLAQNVAGICMYLPFVLLLFAANGTNHSIYSDYESGWMVYSYALPAKAKKEVGARYLGGVVVFVVSFFYGLLHAVVIHVLTGFPLTLEVVKNMLAFLTLAVFVYAWNLPLALKYKTLRAVSVRSAIFCAALYLFCAVKFIMGWERFEDQFGENADTQEVFSALLMGKYEMLRDRLFPFFPLLILGMLGISFLISVKIYQRREGYAGTSL